MKIIANNISIEVQEHGLPEHPAVLLIMGLGMQLIAWPPAVIEPLVQAGYRVISFDNRDIGLSQHFDHLGKPNIVWASIKHKLRLRIQSPYSLQDMAKDAVGVLDAMNIRKAHIVGASMGGMIAQHVACAAPKRVLSLTSIMSSSGARGLPEAKPAVALALLKRPAGNSRQAITAYYEKLYTVIGSPAFPIEPSIMRQRIQASIERGYHPTGTLRQMVAIAADDKRHDLLQQIKSPTLVIHGLCDVLVPPDHGRDVAKRIPGARFIGIEGMGHDLAPGAVAQWLPDLLKHLKHEHT